MEEMLLTNGYTHVLWLMRALFMVVKISIESESPKKDQPNNPPDQKIDFRTDCHYSILLYLII